MQMSFATVLETAINGVDPQIELADFEEARKMIECQEARR
jgi:hypothetical protein